MVRTILSTLFSFFCTDFHGGQTFDNCRNGGDWGYKYQLCHQVLNFKFRWVFKGFEGKDVGIGC